VLGEDYPDGCDYVAKEVDHRAMLCRRGLARPALRARGPRAEFLRRTGIPTEGTETDRLSCTPPRRPPTRPRGVLERMETYNYGPTTWQRAPARWWISWSAVTRGIPSVSASQT
jgi:hypothetical protein